MAKKKLTKDQINQNNLRRQYNAQVRRIKTGYSDISKRGGLFSIEVEDIIGKRYNPERYSKRDITKLKKITKESLYRMARTETGKSGYTILKQRRIEAGRKGGFRSVTTTLSKKTYSLIYNVPFKKVRISDIDYKRYIDSLHGITWDDDIWRKSPVEEGVERLDRKFRGIRSKESEQFYATAQKRREWNEQYRQEVQRLFEQGLAENPRLDAVGNFIHLTPEEFQNIGVTGKYVHGRNSTDYSIENAQVFNALTGEIIESSAKGTTPIEVNGIVYQYDADKHDFYPTRALTRDELKRWYPDQFRDSNSSGIYHEEYTNKYYGSGGTYDFDSLEDEYESYMPSDEPEEERTYPVDNSSYDDEDYDVPDFYTDLDGNTYDEEETKDFINTKLDNIYDRMDSLDSYGEQLREELDSALEEMDDEDKARFLDEFGDDLESSLEAEARYMNDKDGDIRDNERGFNHFHNQSLNIIWNGAVPLTHLNKF